MDANQQRFWMLADADDWSAPSTQWDRVEYDAACRTVRLRDSRPTRSLLSPLNTAGAEALLGTASRAVDAYGAVAAWNPSERSVEVTGGAGAHPRTVTLSSVADGHRVLDLAMGFDDVLYMAVEEVDAEGARVRAYIGMFDPRGRWREPPVFEVDLGDSTAHRAGGDPSGGVWILDRTRREVGRIEGLPLRDGLPPPFAATTFRPRPENLDAPRFFLDPRQPVFAAEERPVALSCSPAGRLAVITWRGDLETWLHLRDQEGEWQPARRLVDPGEGHLDFTPQRRSRPATVAWLSEQRLVVLPGPRVGAAPATMPREAIPYDPDDNTTVLQPGGGFYPVRRAATPLFLKGVTTPPQYLTTGGGRGPSALHPLSVVSYERAGDAVSRRVDGGRDGTVWHRLYLEAVLPEGCGVAVDLWASDDPDAQPLESDWHPHHFGSRSAATTLQATGASAPPRGVWLKDRSEIPHHEGFLDGDSEPDRAGLFTVLVQRSGRRVRRIEGRYLQVRLRLRGTGHLTPQVAALRVYASRFSYRDRYLPELYGEMLFGSDADESGPATRPDFLERFLSLFESVLTPLEDRAVTAQTVMSPASTPPEALSWLASWLGIVFDDSFPEDRRRAWIESAPRLYRTRGTLAGLELALEIATGGRLRRSFVDRRTSDLAQAGSGAEDLWEMEYPQGGGVTGGEIIVLEDYRLRRTLSTILGANLSEEADPLLPGLIVSANSRVGDTLFIGEAEREELLALFRDAFSEEEAQRRSETEAVRDLYDRLAFRATVFVHDSVTAVNFGLLERIAAREAPAHVRVRVVRASYPLLVGLSSLIDLDTYLGPRPKPTFARANVTRIGEGDFVRDDPGLFPFPGELAAAAPPEARVTGPESARRDEDFTLDGSGSTAASGRVIDRYVWILRPSS